VGTNVEVIEAGSYRAQFNAAEKDDEGMALKSSRELSHPYKPSLQQIKNLKRSVIDRLEAKD
jgi:hypothetical protein